MKAKRQDIGPFCDPLTPFSRASKAPAPGLSYKVGREIGEPGTFAGFGEGGWTGFPWQEGIGGWLWLGLERVPWEPGRFGGRPPPHHREPWAGH